MCLNLIDKKGNRVTSHVEKGKLYKNIMEEYSHIAHADMIVYKGLHRDYYGKLNSPHKCFTYEVGEEYYQTNKEPKFSMRRNLWNHEVEIHVGLHAATTIERARIHGYIVCEFIIPKGSTYFIGEYNEIVCDRYIFKSIIEE